MGFSCGIVGLPNVGKSTLFNALAQTHVPAENYPFCTTDHNTGVVSVPDKRLDDIANMFKPERVIPTTIEFVDIAGLVKNAHSGEGLGNKFLGNIRDVDAIAHVVRCFEGDDVVHSYGNLDPKRDAEIVNMELLLADLDIVEKRISKSAHLSKTGNKDEKKIAEICEKLKTTINEGKFASEAELSENEWDTISDLALITSKPMFYVANAGEADQNVSTKSLIDFAKSENRNAISISGKLEAEISELSKEERKQFVDAMEKGHSGLEKVIVTGYKMLDLVTFFTKDGPEVRAWTVKAGTTAPTAAAKIHTDFEKNFIRAEVYNYNELMELGSEHEVKAKGKLRVEGHDYIIKDGDILHIRSG